ncbi:MAG: hypothetical protein E5Y30_11880 [Mesorhizobium sp.]|nr:MAG: hypothetical protein E5Y30_11880 [Mesorhizobium sp.]
MAKKEDFTNAVTLALIAAGMQGKTLKRRRLGYEGVKARDKRIKAFNDKVEKRRAKVREANRARREKQMAVAATAEQRDAIWRLVLGRRGVYFDAARTTGCTPYLADRMKEAARGLGEQADSFAHWDDANAAWKVAKRQKKKAITES